MSRFFISFLGTLVVVIGFFWIWVIRDPMAFLSDSYPLWQSKISMARSLPPDSVACLGDSRAESDLIPSKIAPDVYDLGLTGSGPIEIFAFSRILLASPHPPRAVLLSINPMHFMFTEVFWNFSAPFGLLDYPTLEQIRADARRTDDACCWTSTDTRFEHVRLLFETPTFADISIRLDEALISSGFPSYYYPSLVNGGMLLREKANKKMYAASLEARGYHLRGFEHGTEKKDVSTALPAFTPSPVLDLYLAKTIALYREKNIQIYYVGTPLSDLSDSAMRPEFKASFVAYIKAFEQRYPNFHVLGDPYPIRPASEYSDPGHLGTEAAENFSMQVAGLLHQTGVEK